MSLLRWLLISTEISGKKANPFYVTSYPSNQNIVDIFAHDWSSAMPEEGKCVTTPGQAKLFDDPRVRWAERELGGFQGADVLELGPLEGHHSYMLHKGGAKRVLAIEANSRAFLKCLCVKEMFKLNSVEFLLGDCVEYLKRNEHEFDLVFANGILYHMQNPMQFLELLGKTANRIVMWTHYYDAEHISRNPRLVRRFGPLKKTEYKGFVYEAAQQHYNEGRLLLTLLSGIFPALLQRTGLGWTGFCGGPLSTSTWLTRESILSYLKVLGFTDIKISFESVDQQNGPSFNLCAMRGRS